MGDRELYAAADLPAAQVWDRCINTSERTRGFMDWQQRFPMPFRDTVLARAGNRAGPGLCLRPDPPGKPLHHGRALGRGRLGLMQVMPATARWTARKIGMTDFTPGMINDRDTNITIGTAYLKLALDDFQGSMALAAAGYNAGPGRPRNWRNGPVLDGAIWAENVPFTETRDYVKKVLANTTNYAALITGQPQSLRAAWAPSVPSRWRHRPTTPSCRDSSCPPARCWRWPQRWCWAGAPESPELSAPVVDRKPLSMP
jgi:soluble lytic murein transglycosylase